ncbi:MAG: hypothetical protein NVV70_06340 [Cellulomonas sp.]|nr:hypothetical protein [Cellulomonas sp.]MCR6647763.1 hypothetical protein [Cellulomonas sp.]
MSQQQPQAQPAPRAQRPATYGPPPAQFTQPQTALVPAPARRGHYARSASWYVAAGIILGIVAAIAIIAGGDALGGIAALGSAILLIQGIVGVVQNIETGAANLEYLAHHQRSQIKD